MNISGISHPTKVGVHMLLGQNERISDNYKKYHYIFRVGLQRSRHSETTLGPLEARPGTVKQFIKCKLTTKLNMFKLTRSIHRIQFY